MVILLMDLATDGKYMYPLRLPYMAGRWVLGISQLRPGEQATSQRYGGYVLPDTIGLPDEHQLVDMDGAGSAEWSPAFFGHNCRICVPADRDLSENGQIGMYGHASSQFKP